jgi:hypothetical protein
MKWANYAFSFSLFIVSGVSSAYASSCSEDISNLQVIIDRAHLSPAQVRAEQQAVIDAGKMIKSTGRDAMEIYTALTVNVATSGRDTARQSAGKPTIYQEAEQLKATRVVKAEVTLARAHTLDAARDEVGCREAVMKTKRLLLAQ